MIDSAIVKQPVSFHDEDLILVDAMDIPQGTLAKWAAHEGTGQRHRAFSIFLFNGPHRVMLQRRSLSKPLWPGFWSNSCCSHPRNGESYEDATTRRLWEELGVRAPLKRIYQFEYHAQFGDIGAEHELCSVYVASTDQPASLSCHDDEVMEWDWFSIDEVDRWCAEAPEQLTPWFKQEWHALRTTYHDSLQAALA